MWYLIKIAIFAIAGLHVFYRFRHSAFRPAKYEFYMMWGMEGILLLWLISFDDWFNAAPACQWIANVLLAMAFALIASGYFALKKFGKPIPGHDQQFHLVTQGIYFYMRHPLYAGAILFSISILLRSARLLTGMLCVLVISLFIIASLQEEKENIKKFGSVYMSYKNATNGYLSIRIFSRGKN